MRNILKYAVVFYAGVTFALSLPFVSPLWQPMAAGAQAFRVVLGY